MKISYFAHRAGKLQPGGNHAVSERLRRSDATAATPVTVLVTCTERLWNTVSDKELEGGFRDNQVEAKHLEPV